MRYLQNLYLWCFLGLLTASLALARQLSQSEIATTITALRGGAVDDDYYSQFEIDYGVEDNRRIAGALRGFIKSGALASLPQSDAFLKWIQTYMEEGPKPTKGRLKAYHAADFGNRQDLLPGENPKIVVLQRTLQADDKGMLATPPTDFDVDVREVWQPWLKSKCNFAVRYVIPDRVNIVKILASQRRFSSELHIETAKDNESGKESKAAWINMKFKPTWRQRLTGKRDVVIKYPVDAERLLSSNSKR